MQYCSNSSALAMELLQSCTTPCALELGQLCMSIYIIYIHIHYKITHAELAKNFHVPSKNLSDDIHVLSVNLYSISSDICKFSSEISHMPDNFHQHCSCCFYDIHVLTKSENLSWIISNFQGQNFEHLKKTVFPFLVISMCWPHYQRSGWGRPG